MKRGPANESIQVAVVGSIWGFGYKMDGTVIDYIQFADQSVGGNFVNDIAQVKDRQDSQFYEGMFGSMSEGGFVAKQEADSRFNLYWRCLKPLWDMWDGSFPLGQKPGKMQSAKFK